MNHDVMKPLTKPLKRKRYAVVDIETKDGNTQEKGFTRPFLAGYYDGEQYLESRGQECLDAMFALMCTAEHDGWCFYAHYGGNFDWLHFLPIIKRSGFGFEIYNVCSSIQMLHIKPEGAHRKGWFLLDSYKLIPNKLADACITFGTSNKIADFDLDLPEWDPDWSKYLKQDCVSLFEVLEKFHDLVEVVLQGEVGITAASTAMKTYRRSYQKAPIQRHSQHEAFFRNCYYGGRTEIFKKSGKGLHYYDINSAYPHAMRAPMPVGDILEVRHRKPSKALMATHIGFTWARVEMPPVHVPCLPVKHNEKLLFPVGRLQGYWCSIELERAEEQGATVHWDRTLLIEGETALRDYVDHLYQFRDKSRKGYDKALDSTAKLLMNSLYGKFGMSHEKEKIVVLQEGDNIPVGARPADPKDPDCSVWHVEEDVESSYIIPQISAYITAKARLRLHDFLLAANEDGGLCYCDTDSVQCTTNLDHLCSGALGDIKDEGKGNTFSGEYLQPKLYCLEGEKWEQTMLATKGFRKLSKAEYLRIRAGESITLTSLEKVGAMARKQFASGPKMRTIEKQLRSVDVKREYLENGETRAITLEQW